MPRPNRPPHGRAGGRHPGRRSGPRPGSGPRRDPASLALSEAPQAERLQKVLAAAGLGSRRACEELIQAGRVDVDGQTVTQLGTKVTPDQQIKVDGSAIRVARKSYYLVHKPVGVVTTNFDPSGRPRVIDLLPNMKERLFPVGRLDRTSSGLILLTNDGELSQRLTHPKYGVEKTYRVQIAGVVDQNAVSRLIRGVHLAEGVAKADSVRVRSVQKNSTWLEIVLSEGKNREIRRILAKVGHKVLSLKRMAVGSLRLGELQPGEYRLLTSAEVAELWRETTKARKRASARPAAPRPAKSEVGAAGAEENEVFIAEGVTIGGQAVESAIELDLTAAPDGDWDEGGLDDEFGDDGEDSGETSGEDDEDGLLIDDLEPGDLPAGSVIGMEDAGDPYLAEQGQLPQDPPREQRGKLDRGDKDRGNRDRGSRERGNHEGGRPPRSEQAFVLNSKGKRRRSPPPRGKGARGKGRPMTDGAAAGRAVAAGEGGDGAAAPPRKSKPGGKRPFKQRSAGGAPRDGQSSGGSASGGGRGKGGGKPRGKFKGKTGAKKKPYKGKVRRGKGRGK